MPCDTPHFVPNPTYPWDASGKIEIPVPCGRCPVCKKTRTNQWMFRLRQENKVALTSHFITLTYDTDHIPITPNGFPTLDKKAFPLFMKRLRKKSKGKLKYYAVGEYGSKTSRPHYHAILFNALEKDIHSSWTLGGVHIGVVNDKTTGYTAKYINKPKRIPAFAADDRIREFSLMSKGIGSSYMSPEMIKYHKSDLSRNFVTIEDGIKLPLPRYYREKIYTDYELKAQRRIIATDVHNDDIQSEQAYLRKNPHGDYALYLEQCRIGRYKKFYHFTNQNRGL